MLHDGRHSSGLMGERPTSKSVLGALTKARLQDVGRDVGFPVPQAAKDRQIDLLVKTGRIHFRELLAKLGRDELKAICRLHGLDDDGRARAEPPLRSC